MRLVVTTYKDNQQQPTLTAQVSCMPMLTVM
jgi:hypothetical protein